MPTPARSSAKLLPHELALAKAGELTEVTHERASARWLRADSVDVARVRLPGIAACHEIAKAQLSQSDSAGHVASDLTSWLDFIADPSPLSAAAASDDASASTPLVAVYRPMADTEFAFLLQHGTLPATQPYHAIMPALAGREYSEKYLNGKKRVDTGPSSVVEFLVPEPLLSALMRRQHKAEDGCMSHGLGSKAGRTVEVFNSWLRFGRSALSDATGHTSNRAAAADDGTQVAGSTGGGSTAANDAPPDQQRTPRPAVWRLVVVKRRPL
jgi:hypothetical protein